jgi:hypothetical protein
MTNWMMPESRNCCVLPKIYCALARQSARVLYAGGFADSDFILSRTQPTLGGTLRIAVHSGTIVPPNDRERKESCRFMRGAMFGFVTRKPGSGFPLLVTPGGGLNSRLRSVRCPDLNLGQVERYLHDLYRARPEFVYSVSRDFAGSCKTPILVLPDETPAHPPVSSVEVASPCPNAEITVFPWREPPELKARTIDRVRKFLQMHRLSA